MKFITVVLSIFAFGTMAFAQETETAAMPEPIAAVQTNNMIAQKIVLETKEAPRWNISLGMSKFETAMGTNNVVNYKGNGLTIELQRRFGQSLFIGGSYTNYRQESSNLINYLGENIYTVTSEHVFTASAEIHPIKVELPQQSQFFAAITGGVMASSETYSHFNRYYYGAGLGVNYSNQLGLRADMKASPDFKTFNTVSLVGYY